MALKNVFPVSTRLRKNGPKFPTMVTCDYSGVNVGDGKLVADAEKSMVITAQNQWRRAGKIPAQFTIAVATFVSGSRSANVEPAAVMAVMSDAELSRAYEREIARRAAEKSDAKKPAAKRAKKPHPADVAAQPAPNPAQSGGDGERT